MRIIFTIFILFICTEIFSAESIVTKEVITLRCEILKQKRTEKVDIKNRLQSLIKKNDKLTQIAGDKRVMVREKLSKNMTMLKRELVLVKVKIQKIEEEIIRKGCPPLDL